MLHNQQIRKLAAVAAAFFIDILTFLVAALIVLCSSIRFTETS